MVRNVLRIADEAPTYPQYQQVSEKQPKATRKEYEVVILISMHTCCTVFATVFTHLHTH